MEEVSEELPSSLPPTDPEASEEMSAPALPSTEEDEDEDCEDSEEPVLLTDPEAEEELSTSLPLVVDAAGALDASVASPSPPTWSPSPERSENRSV